MAAPVKQLLVILGMPGAGKDTQIALLQHLRPSRVIRIGDLVRGRAKNDPEVAEAMRTGELVKDELVNELVLETLATTGSELLISDGFPRDIDQAKWLDTTLKNQNIQLIGALYLHISDTEALKRLLKRGREDDTESTIQHRLEVFHNQTDVVVDYYKQQGLLMQVDGEQSVEAVAADSQKALAW